MEPLWRRPGGPHAGGPAGSHLQSRWP